MTDTAPEHGGDAPRRPGGRVVRPLLIIVAAVVVIWLVLTVIDEIDFAVVGEALARVSLAQMLVLLAVVLVRQVLNAVPLTAFVPEVGLLRSMQCDAGASVVATFAPPPGDLALRYTMYRSWDVDPVAGFAGFTLNTVLFYVVRFGAPLLGLVGLLVLRWQDDGASGFALTSVAIAAAIAVAVVLVARADRAASTVGHIAGRLAHRVRPQVDPEDWAEHLVKLRDRAEARLRAGWPVALGALVVGVVTEAVLLVLAARYVGVPSGAVPALGIASALLIAYPLTALPFFGLGFVEAAVLTILSAQFGNTAASEITAALIIWRAATMLVPLVIGGLVLLSWRRHHDTADSAAPGSR